MEKVYAISNFDEIKEKVMTMCKTRSSNGLRGLRILFRAMDCNRNNSFEPMEFKYAKPALFLIASDKSIKNSAFGKLLFLP